MSFRTLRWLLLPLLVVPLLLVLLHGFGRDPRAVPSRLIGKPIPSFTLVTLDGRTITSKELRGKPALVNFWASWCAPCVQEHAVLLEAAKRYGSALQIVGVLYQDSVDGARSFDARYGEPSWPTLIDANGALALDFGVSGPPESYFVDANGIVRYKQFGPLTLDAVSERASLLLGNTNQLGGS